jgi:hypothetical protein
VAFAMFVHIPRGALATPTVNVVTSVGRSWMMWDMARMTLVFVGAYLGGFNRGLKLIACVLRTRCRGGHILVGYDGNGGIRGRWNEDSQICQRKRGELLPCVIRGSS